MISRRTAKLIAEMYHKKFTYVTFSHSYGRASSTTYVHSDALYDFLYIHEYAPWFCNLIKGLFHGERAVKDLVMKLHTGETQAKATPDWTWEQRQQLGQQYLKDLAKDFLNDLTKGSDPLYKEDQKQHLDTLIKALELDGYIYRDSQLLYPESDVLDTNEERGVLHELYSRIHLDNQETAFHHMSLSEEHYSSGKWDDSISNSRKYLECVLLEVAATHRRIVKKLALPEHTFSKPYAVRDYLEDEGLLETKEKEALDKVYSLLSHTGSHPYMAQHDQARLLRHLSLTFSQFVMLRLEGCLRSAAPD
jgi:hypothetical protein